MVSGNAELPRLRHTNRGAEQGDVLGTVQSVLVLGDALDTHLRLPLLPLESKGVCDEWFVDDGQVFVRPWSFEGWLRALDAALASFRETRGCIVHGNVKSSARLLCPPGRILEFQGWDTPYAHDNRHCSQSRLWDNGAGVSLWLSRADQRACLGIGAFLRRNALGDHWPPPRWCSPGSAWTCPSSCTTCASTVTSWTTTCLLLSMGNCAPPSAPPCVVTYRIALGGRPGHHGGLSWWPWPSRPLAPLGLHDG